MARVLVVEDNEDSALLLAELVKSWGHSVRVAFDGASAVEQFSQFLPELALVDISLPGLSGYDVARAVRASSLAVRPTLVALTGFGQEHDRLRAVDAGFDLHLVKPVDPESLERLLNG